MLHEDKLAEVRREYFKLVDYELVTPEKQKEYEQRIEQYTPKEQTK